MPFRSLDILKICSFYLQSEYCFSSCQDLDTDILRDSSDKNVEKKKKRKRKDGELGPDGLENTDKPKKKKLKLKEGKEKCKNYLQPLSFCLSCLNYYRILD